MFWKLLYPPWQLASAIVATQVVAVLICGFGFLVPTLSWIFISLVWVYNTVWMIALDIIKLGIYRVVEFRARHQHFLVSTMNQPLHPFSTSK